MSQQLNQAFGRELAAMRQAEFEAEAVHHALVRRLKRARRVQFALAARSADGADAASSRTPAVHPARACCAADLG